MGSQEGLGGVSEPLIFSFCVILVLCLSRAFKLQAIPRYCGSFWGMQNSHFQNSDCLLQNDYAIKFRTFFSDTLSIKKNQQLLSTTGLMYHLLYPVNKRKLQVHNLKCISTAERLEYELKYLHNFSEK